MSKNILYFIVAAVILIVLGGIVFYFTQRSSKELQKSTVPAANRKDRKSFEHKT